jgi:hypothetical protein
VGEFEALWETSGRRVAASLDDVCAIAVIGDDPIATASVALGIGRIQALRRRVALGDLIGDVPPLRALIDDDDPHGIADSFLYGVSLNRIARAVAPGGNLHILPSGGEFVLQEEIVRNPRWGRLAAGFREVGALLLLAAPTSVPGLEVLFASLDGVVLVGDTPRPGPGIAVLAEVRNVSRRTPRDPMHALRDAALQVHPPRRRRLLVPSLVLAGLALGAAVLWFGRDQFLTSATRKTAALTDARRIPTPAPVAAPAPSDSTATDSAPSLTVANVADSASAAGFAVALTVNNTEAGASLRVKQSGDSLPATTYGPIALGTDRVVYYRVLAGAFPRRASADSLLAALQARSGTTPTGGVVRAPLAFLLVSRSAPATARTLIEGYRARGVPAYALTQPDGTTNIYAGAFETADQAGLFASTLKSTNIDAILVYRVGGAF